MNDGLSWTDRVDRARLRALEFTRVRETVIGAEKRSALSGKHLHHLHAQPSFFFKTGACHCQSASVSETNRKVRRARIAEKQFPGITFTASEPLFGSLWRAHRRETIPRVLPVIFTY